jgi:ACS family hexuronate transporter-like MFS transporter
MACVGSIGAGWFSGSLIKSGLSVNRARKMALLTCAVLVVPIIFASNVPQWLGILLFGLAAAAHQGWSANLYTVCSDMFPKNIVASIVGIGSTIGAISTMSFQIFAGFVLEFTGSYMYLFVICGFLYIVAFIVFSILVPGLEPVSLREENE